ncbi:MAG: caspase family protein [Methylibium sp.]
MKSPAPFRHAIAALVLTTGAVSAQAPVDVRVALVIGNAAYPGPAALVNPVNDARAMSATLKTLGFTVVDLKDASLSQMSQAVAQVRQSLAGKKGIGVLYYAGHGLQVDFRNFMVPVDAQLGSAADVPRQTVDVSQVIDAFREAGNRMNILVLDACRDNPFSDKASAKGLAPLDAPSGTFLAYATAPGNVAADGDPGSTNGLYTGYLVKELQKPATKIEDVFKRVRLQVRQHSKGRQIPWESTSLEEDFYFNDGAKYTFRTEDLQRVAAQAQARADELSKQAEAAAVRERELAAAAAAAREQQDRDRREAELAAERQRQATAAKALAELKAAEERRQQELAVAAQQAREADRLARLSRERAAEEAFNTQKAHWDRIKDSREVDEFYAFVNLYPSGSMAELAQSKIERLEAAQIQTQAGPDGKVQGSVAMRYRTGDRYDFILKDGLTGVTRSRMSIEVRWRGEDEMEGVVVSGAGTGARATQAGFVLEDGAGTYDPPWSALPGGEFQIGKRTSGRSILTQRNGNRIWVDYDSRIVAREQIETAFGPVDTYRVEVAFFNQNGVRSRITFWYDPDWGYAVRLRREARDRFGAPDIFVREMVARSRKD